MLRVLLVDDEPYILQGLSVLIDWEKEGFEIVGTVSNGEEAVGFLKSSQVDLIMADIKMPVMNGLELLKNIRERHLSDAFFVILSGYGDFSYAKEAIHYQCTDYILKPIQKSQLIELLGKVKLLEQRKKQEQSEKNKMDVACFARHMQALLLGRLEEDTVHYVEERVGFGSDIRYIDIEPENTGELELMSSEEKRKLQRQIYESTLNYLTGEQKLLVFMDAAGKEELFDVGFIFHDGLLEQGAKKEQEYLKQMLEHLQSMVRHSVVMYVGNKVADIRDIAESFRTAVVAKTFQDFKVVPNLLFYSEEMKKSLGTVVSKKKIDELLHAVEENDRQKTEAAVDEIYEEMNIAGMNKELIQMNMNYLLYRLVQLAIEQDASVNQDEILQYIRENAFETHMIRGSKNHFKQFVLEYADYLGQLRRNVSRGVLANVEEDIRKNFAQNITLKELSKKYFVNSAYLGQMFRKQYGVSFKEYLNRFRIEKATEILLRTDEKVYLVAEEVGYHDLDYFINRFIQIKGCTPTSYRKKARD